MSKAKDILEKLKQRREIADAVRAYWADVLPDIGQLPEAQLQSWLLRFDLDVIIAGLDAAVTQRSKRDAKGDPMTATEAVNFASAVMNRLHLEGLPEGEREKIKAHREHIKAVRSAAAHKRWDNLPKVASVSTDLHDFADPLHTAFASAVAVEVSGSVSSSSSPVYDREKSKPTLAPLAAVIPEKEEKRKTQTNTNPSGASGVTPNQSKDKVKSKSKTIMTARGEKPKPDDFDFWSNVQRTEWIACTLDCYESGWNFEHMTDCAACGQAKAAAAGESLTSENQIKYGNPLGVPAL